MLGLLLDDGLLQFRELKAPVDTPAAVRGSGDRRRLATRVPDRLGGAAAAARVTSPSSPPGSSSSSPRSSARASTRSPAPSCSRRPWPLWAVVQRAHSLSQGVWLTVDRRTAARFGPACRRRPQRVGVARRTRRRPTTAGSGRARAFYEWRSLDDPTRQVISPYVSVQKPPGVAAGRRDVHRRLRATVVLATRRTRHLQRRLLVDPRKLRGRRRRPAGLAAERGDDRDDRADVLDHRPVRDLAARGLRPEPDPRVRVDHHVERRDQLAHRRQRHRELRRTRVHGWSRSSRSSRPRNCEAPSRSATPSSSTRYTEFPPTSPDRRERGAADHRGAEQRLRPHARPPEHSSRSSTTASQLSRRDGDPIEQFLAERIGFCQQFSGTFALMARSLGLAARVAVGFTWGDPVEGEENTYRVTGRHTHAWPEVYFEGLGWVAFEPTPGEVPRRRAPVSRPGPGLRDTAQCHDHPSPCPTTAAPDPTIARRPPDRARLHRRRPGLRRRRRWPVDPVAGGRPLLALVAYASPCRCSSGCDEPDAWPERRPRRPRSRRSGRISPNTCRGSCRSTGGPTRPAREWVERLIQRSTTPGHRLRRLGATADRVPIRTEPVHRRSEATTARLDAAVVDALIYERTPLWRRWLTMLDPRNLLRRPGRSVAV